MTTSSSSSQPFRLAEPDTDRSNTATWHVAVRMYLDAAFRDFVLNNLYEPLDQALAPDPAIDPGFVVRRGNHARSINCAVMLSLWLVGALILVLETLAVAMFLVGAFLLWLAIASVAHQSSAQPSLRMETYPDAERLLEPLRFKVLFWLGIGLVLFGWASSGTGTWRGLLELAVLGSISTGLGIYRAKSIASIPDQKNPPGIRSRRIKRFESNQGATVTTHRTDKLAFVGFGALSRPQLIAFHLQSSDGSGAASNVDLDLMVKALWAETEALAEDSEDAGETEHGVARLSIAEQVFADNLTKPAPIDLVAELDMGGRKYDPFADASPARMLSVRPYLRIQVAQGGGELVINLFVRVEKIAGQLVIDLVPCRLLPTVSCFKLFESGEVRVGPLLRRAGAVGFLTMPLAVFQAPFSLGKTLWRWWGRVQWRLGKFTEVGPQRPVAATGIRQMGSEAPEDCPNAVAAAERMELVLVQHCLRVLRDHLKDRGIDVTVLESKMGIVAGRQQAQHETHIHNNGGKLAIGMVGTGEVHAGAIGNDSRGLLYKLGELLKL